MPQVIKSPDGRIWFLPWDGVSVINPRQLPFNSQPPPVHIEQITADGKICDAPCDCRLPPRVRDDGKRVGPAVLADQGLQGHYGLRGMRERSTLIGGKLAVWSEADAGTEVELHLPASIVYATSARRTWWSRLLARQAPANARGDAS